MLVIVSVLFWGGRISRQLAYQPNRSACKGEDKEGRTFLAQKGISLTWNSVREHQNVMWQALADPSGCRQHTARGVLE
jgi:hypothetical protein